MNKKPVILEISCLDSMIGQDKHYGFMVAMLSWLISEFHSKQEDKLTEVKLEVVKTFGKFGGAYPSLAIYSDTIDYFDYQYNLIEERCNEILKQKSAIEFAQFVSESEHDWNEIATNLMK